MERPGSRVYSKAQALSQCRNWLGKNLPQASAHLVDVVSSAEAAAIAQKDPGHAAAIASKPAADAYGLKILVENIEDQANNTHPLRRHRRAGEGQRTGRDKTTMMLRLSNKSGTLAKAIEPFEKNAVNMTWIESFPTSEGALAPDPTYLFFLDVDGHAEDEPVKKAIDAARKRVERDRDPRELPERRCHRGVRPHLERGDFRLQIDESWVADKNSAISDSRLANHRGVRSRRFRAMIPALRSARFSQPWRAYRGWAPADTQGAAVRLGIHQIVTHRIDLHEALPIVPILIRGQDVLDPGCDTSSSSTATITRW